jgi:peptidoglycan/xylan/chitin deacetylase (PgdA/CDA1 family)
MQLDLKRAFKCGVSLGVFACSGVRDFLLRLLGAKSKGTCVILYYHSIPRDQQQRFADQLDVILRYAKPIAVGEPLILNGGERYVGVTFDDGFENFAEVALPEMARRGIPSTVFIIADALGKAFGPHGHPERVMSADKLCKLPQNLVAVGSHTLTHPFLPSLAEHEAGQEIAGSRAKIGTLLNRNVSLFSFPFGGFNEKLVEQCREAGYQRVFTTLPQFTPENADAFVVGRVRVDPDDWPLEFRLKLAGAYRWLPWAFALKRKVLSNGFTRRILAHEFSTDTSGGRQSVIQELGSL